MKTTELDINFTGVNWSYVAEQFTAAALGMVPDAGPLLAGLVYIFWPPTTDTWAEVEEQAEQLMQQKLDQTMQEDVDATLKGLKNASDAYLLALRAGTPEMISAQWIATTTAFVTELPHLQLPSYKALMLSTFTQAANMHLALLRDGVLGGASWGWPTAYVNECQAKLVELINTYRGYVYSVYEEQLGRVQATAPVSAHECQPFRTVNNFVRQMTLTTLDFADMWTYFDATGSVAVELTREIYSDPMGTCDNSGNIVLPGAPTQPISQITVWGWDRIDAVQVTYPTGGGPNGETKTPRMGNASGGSDDPPHGGVFDVTNNPVVIATAGTGDVVNFMYFTFADGTQTYKLGGNYPGGTAHDCSYYDEILSSIWINGVSKAYGSADSVVFGFKYQQPWKMWEGTKRIVYVSAPVIPESIASSATEEWKEARGSYWARLEATQAK